MLGIKLLLIMNICFLQGYTALTPSIHRHRPTQTCHLGWTGGCQRALSDGGGWVIIFGTVCISVFPCRKSGLSHLLSSCWVIRECLFRSPYFSFTEQNMILWPTMAHSLTSQWSANEVLLTTFSRTTLSQLLSSVHLLLFVCFIWEQIETFLLSFRYQT